MTKGTPDIEKLREDWKQISAEIMSESDRGAILIGTAYLDDSLHVLLDAVFVDDKVVLDLLKDGGAFGTFHRRIHLAYGIGLITKKLYNDIEVIRGIRNELAHGYGRCSFETSEIVDKCKRLETCLPAGTTLYGIGLIRAKGCFASAVAFISIKLQHQAGLVERATPGRGFKMLERSEWLCRLLFGGNQDDQSQT